MTGQTKEKSVCNGEDMFTMQEVRDERKLTRIRKLPIVDITELQMNLFLRSLTRYSESVIKKIY